MGWAQARGEVREEGFQCSEETGGGGTERKELCERRAQPAQPGHGCLRREQLKRGFQPASRAGGPGLNRDMFTKPQRLEYGCLPSMGAIKQLLRGAPLTDTCALSAYLEVRHNPSLGVTLLGAGITPSVCPSLRSLGTALILPPRQHHLYQESCWSSLSWPLHHPASPTVPRGHLSYRSPHTSRDAQAPYRII